MCVLPCFTFQFLIALSFASAKVIPILLIPLVDLNYNCSVFSATKIIVTISPAARAKIRWGSRFNAVSNSGNKYRAISASEPTGGGSVIVSTSRWLHVIFQAT